MSYENLKFHKASTPAPGVLHVEINRPEKLNAMDEPTWREYGKLMAEAGADPEVRAIVLSGAGRALCAGLDVMGSAGFFSELAELEESRRGIKLSNHIREFQSCIDQPTKSNTPVIAVAHGPSIGLAIDILCCTDVRFASKDVKLSVREINIGMAADIGTLQRLPKIVGSLGWVKDVALSGRDFDANEALAQGFVQKVFDTKDQAVSAAIEYAAALAAKSPVAVFGTKKAIDYAMEHSTKDSLDQIAEFNAYALGSDFVEGSMAFRSKDKPKYPNLPKL